MNRRIIFSFFLFALFVFTCSCGKEEAEVFDDLVFHSLVAEKDTVAPGETVKIKANATGNKIEYFWSVNLGDIIGSGSEIIYAASPCAWGSNEVTCTVTNGNQTESKTIDIVVYE